MTRHDTTDQDRTDNGRETDAQQQMVNAAESDGATDEQVRLELSQTHFRIREHASATLVCVDRIYHTDDPTEARRIADEARRELLALFDQVDESEELELDLGYRLHQARAGRPDPSTLTFEERLRDRVIALVELAREFGVEGIPAAT